MEGRSKLKIGRKETHDMGNPWPHLEVKRSKVKVTGPLKAVTENQLYLRNRKPAHFKRGTRMEYYDPHQRCAALTSEVKGRAQQTA